MTTVYIAGARSDRSRAEEMAVEMRSHKVEVLSQWHAAEELPADSPVLDARTLACTIADADLFIALTGDTGGKNLPAEVGFALGRDVPIIVVGESPRFLLGQLIRATVRDDEEAMAVVFGMQLEGESRQAGRFVPVVVVEDDDDVVDSGFNTYTDLGQVIETGEVGEPGPRLIDLCAASGHTTDNTDNTDNSDSIGTR